jgi:putative two-component system response regulator
MLAASIEGRVPYTEGHGERVSRYSVALADRLGLPEEDRVALRRGGTVHDIGKIGVPERILLKRGPLDSGERTIVEAHTVIGERICAPLKSLRNALPIIRWHHERQDGTGYPDRLQGTEVPLTARVLQTADIYDALSTSRPYRAALAHEKVFVTMREEVARGWWDGALVDELEALLRASPELIAPADPVRANGAQPGPMKAEEAQRQEELAWASYVQVA